MNICVNILRIPLIILNFLAGEKCGCAKRDEANNRYVFCNKIKLHTGPHKTKYGLIWKKD